MNTLKKNRKLENREHENNGFALPLPATIVAMLLAFCLFVILPLTVSAKQTPDWLDLPVTIQFQNKPLREVLAQIGKQTGISILYDQALANEPVIGNFQNITASDAVTRLFKGKNKIIQVDDAKKVIVVKTFGAKNFIWAGPTESDKPITLAELNEIHARQYEQYRERITDENEILESGITRGEVHALHEAQYLAYKERLSNKDERIPEAGNLTRGELSAIQKNQYESYRARLLNEDEIIDTDQQISRKQLQSMQQEQYSSYRKRIEKPGSQIAENGESLAAIHEMQKQQYADYKARKNDKSIIIDSSNI